MIWPVVSGIILMKGHIGTENFRCVGYDISETACVMAKQSFPEFDFFQLDLTNAVNPQPAGCSLFVERFGMRSPGLVS